MNRLGPQKPQFRPKNSGIFTTRIERIPRHLSDKEVTGYILTHIEDEANSDTGVFEAHCGCEIPCEEILKPWKKKHKRTWTGRFACKDDHAVCQMVGCSWVVCICGDADGLEVEKGSGEFFCTDHFSKALKEFKSSQFREGFTSFWSGFGGDFIRGLFGGK